MNIQAITEGIYYVGVNDRAKQFFEAIWPLPNGVTYNSYIVKGAHKTALIDGVEISEACKLQKNIREIIGCDAPDYLVINHMEPDHSGSIGILRSFFPDMTIVGNAKTLEMVKGFYGIDDNVMKVADGDTLDLGDLTLSFHLTPMVHWPETMMTYVKEKSVIFTGDAFGCFGALNGAVVDSEMDTDPYFPEMYRYYSNIVGKYGVFVQKALSKLKGLKISYICSTHGPVWHEQLNKVVDIYDRLSRYEAEPGVVIVYGSMYGNTEEMAEIIAKSLAESGIRNIRMHNASYSHISYILSDIYRYKGLIIGAPTYSNALFPPVEALVQAIKTREVKNRLIATFGSHTWAPQSIKRMNAVLEEAKLKPTEFEPVDMKQGVTESVEDALRSLAEKFADRL
ncbi:MAG: FprA family A-type flavoprotein [Muribaculum sp.]|nr:FprA family A-type flavoprotein [Muribaculum sp.]